MHLAHSKVTASHPNNPLRDRLSRPVSLLKKTLNALKDAHLSMQHLSAKAIGIVDTDERAILLTSIGNHISRKVVFDENVKKWLGERDVSQEVIEGLLRIPKSLRSHTASSRSYRSGRSSTSSARRAQAIAKQEVARLKLAYLQQRQDLEQQEIESKLRREQEEAELKRRYEMEALKEKQHRDRLEAKQELQEASIAREVLEEESERGGYIPLDDHDLRELAKAASSSKSIVAREPTAVKLTQHASSSTPLETRHVSKKTFVNDGSDDTVQGIASVLREGLDTPKPELFKFDGNPMYYTRFVMNFEASIESKRLLSTASKLLLLIVSSAADERFAKLTPWRFQLNCIHFLLLRVTFFWAILIKTHEFFCAVFSKEFSIKQYSFCQFS